MEELKDAYTPEWKKWIQEKDATFSDEVETTDFMSARDLYYSRKPSKPVEADQEGKVAVTWLCEHPRASAISSYLSKLLKAGNFRGTYEIQGTGGTMDFITLNFRKSESQCPACGMRHPDYNFQYKVRIGKYGGWKCWKTDRWQTQYHLEDLDSLFSN